jgi:hypothetical protein
MNLGSGEQHETEDGEHARQESNAEHRSHHTGPPAPYPQARAPLSPMSGKRYLTIRLAQRSRKVPMISAAAKTDKLIFEEIALGKDSLQANYWSMMQ